MTAARGGLKNAMPERLRLRMRSVWYAVRSMAYRGNRVVCPVCEGHFRTFLPFGLDKRPNAQCPHCGCLERHRLLWLYLRDRTNLFEGIHHQDHQEHQELVTKNQIHHQDHQEHRETGTKNQIHHQNHRGRKRSDGALGVLGGKNSEFAGVPGVLGGKNSEFLGVSTPDSGLVKVLEFAPTPVLQSRFRRAKNLDYVSADLSSTVAMLRMDITAINFPADQFDAIICYHVLEHVLDDRKAISELFRVLKPGGWAILQSPIDEDREKTFEAPDVTSPRDRERVFGQSDHVRIYGRDYPARLEQAGFQVRLDDYVHDLGLEQAVKYGLMAGEKVHFCRKPLVPEV